MGGPPLLPPAPRPLPPPCHPTNAYARSHPTPQPTAEEPYDGPDVNPNVQQVSSGVRQLEAVGSACASAALRRAAACMQTRPGACTRTHGRGAHRLSQHPLPWTWISQVSAFINTLCQETEIAEMHLKVRFG